MTDKGRRIAYFDARNIGNVNDDHVHHDAPEDTGALALDKHGGFTRSAARITVSITNWQDGDGAVSNNTMS